MSTHPESGVRLLVSNPSGRLGESWDAAGAAIFLLSKGGSYVNGATINLDGGSWLGSKL